ncbi:quinone-dependent dihydroorotate dehydrogenase [Nocardioides sp. CFH 31398]|uniref:quinone-dependent dihydroorotate dehydrogenase n=1 Tax=Nocardioides sp. CFH 31398 TaxID=2919579 RepID=UPI001F051011|nr:quinone-dependent dihydroorotate dehydrogenase [Nocardioides sp. CFH 31398]MCH1868583.1 quinone-dependent dihydroorotate dehydrogenase [Nocardioides sp. CFH 31398]
MSTYRRLFDVVATRIDAERAHRVGFAAVRAARPVLQRAPVAPSGARPVTAMGLRFSHPLGLAAGFDKNAVGVDALAGLGFSHVEVGTVTGRPQPGNPRPRLFRLPADRAVVNRMGFNNEGAEAVASRLALRAARLAHAGRTPDVVLGVNIGKTKVVADDEAVADHELSAGLLAPYADYLVVNVSSPNTPGLRDLQNVERLEPILAAVRRRADTATPHRTSPLPLLVKIAPDLADEDVEAVADLAVAQGLAGIVATNTTIARDGLLSPPADVAAAGAGGLSGAPVAARSREVLRLLHRRAGDRLTLVSVGGIADAAEASERLRDGATLLQSYTGFVYEGPAFVRRTVAGLVP